MFSFRKNHEIQKNIHEYCHTGLEMIPHFQKAIVEFMDNGIGDNFDLMITQAHQMESHADDLRRDIEYKLYALSLMPESRRDVLNLIESTDRILGRAESILFMIQTQSLVLPKIIYDDFANMNNISCDAFELLIKAMLGYFGKDKRIKEYIRAVHDRESTCDVLTRKMIHTIFQSDMDKFDILLTKDLILAMEEMSDICERVADQITIIDIKHHI